MLMPAYGQSDLTVFRNKTNYFTIFRFHVYCFDHQIVSLNNFHIVDYHAHRQQHTFDINVFQCQENTLFFLGNSD